MKTLEVWRQSLPDNPALGYGDNFQICVDNVSILSGNISSCPIPYHPQTKEVWWKLYGIVADGRYKFKCVMHYRFGKCLLIENGGPIPSVNTLHGRDVLNAIFVHSGGRNSKNKTWRGSRGCFTVHPDHWDEFMSKYDYNETGYLILTSKIKVSEDVWKK